MQKLETDSKRFKGFRKAAPSTQKKQDRHLELYTDFILWRAGREAEDFSSADELEEFRFPSNNMEQLFENLRQFLLLVYQMANPISLRTGMSTVLDTKLPECLADALQASESSTQLFSNIVIP